MALRPFAVPTASLPHAPHGPASSAATPATVNSQPASPTGPYAESAIIDSSSHLSRFAKGLHRGSHMRRGQLIGYVGENDWATGPHLHYEVRVNHVPRNPLTVRLPDRSPLHSKERERFAQRAKRLAALMSAG